MVQISGIAGSFARLFTQAAKPATEFQFNQIQNTAIRRINDETDAIIQKYDRSDEVAQLQKDRNKLADAIPDLQQYRFQTIGNKLRMDNAYDAAIAGVGTYPGSTEDQTLTQEQADSINAFKTELREQIRDLYTLVNPDVFNPDTVGFLKKAAAELDNYEAVAGTVDPEGTDEASATNQNRALKDLLNDMVTKTLGAVESTTSTIRVTNDTIDSFNGKIAVIDAEFVEIQAVDQQLIQQEVDDIRAEYANVLQAISLSFDLQNQYVENLAKGVHDRSIEPGSIMNLFS